MATIFSELRSQNPNIDKLISSIKAASSDPLAFYIEVTENTNANSNTSLPSSNDLKEFNELLELASSISNNKDNNKLSDLKSKVSNLSDASLYKFINHIKQELKIQQPNQLKQNTAEIKQKNLKNEQAAREKTQRKQSDIKTSRDDTDNIFKIKPENIAQRMKEFKQEEASKEEARRERVKALDQSRIEVNARRRRELRPAAMQAAAALISGQPGQYPLSQ